MTLFIEILDNPEVLTQPRLDLHTLHMDRVIFGSTTDSFPCHKISEVTFSPVVFRQTGGGREAEYFDADGNLLTFDQVIESVIHTNGQVHFANKTSYKIQGGRVVGFAIYGAHLEYFASIKTHEELVQRFGTPDVMKSEEAYGDLMGYSLYYYGSSKHVRWCSVTNEIILINLGAYPNNQPEAAT
ncbi:MAG: hypothetical protein K1Y36_03690 [Blastocatellia bacterium]|nr:hypothetical protein [Blastocatellia bacterium]